MSAFRRRGYGLAVAAAFACSFILVVMYLRFDEMKYAEAVTKASLQLCPLNDMHCAAGAVQNSSVMDPGLKTDIPPATLIVGLTWLSSAILVGISFIAVRLFGKIFRVAFSK